MKTEIIKQDLTIYFNAMPFIGKYLQYDYNTATTYNDMANLVHKWLNEAEISKNPIRKQCFKASAYRIYSLITGKSFESKITI